MTMKRLSRSLLQRQTGTPGRNMVFASLAVVYARAIDAENIALTTAFGSTFPDTSLSFLKSLQDTAQAALDRPIRIFSPFKQKRWTDADVVKQGSRLGIPLEVRGETEVANWDLGLMISPPFFSILAAWSIS